MLKSYFLITFRSMLKNKLFILINVCGMGVAVACCIVAYLANQYDSTFNAQHKQKGSIYRIGHIREFGNKLTRFGYCPLPLGEVIDKTFNDVSASTRLQPSNTNFKLGDDLFPANLSYVDPEFFEMFSIELLSGRPADLRDKTSIFISESMATRLFETPEAAQGKTITQVMGTELKELKVAGVFRDQPMNSSFYSSNGAAFVNFDNYKDEYPRDFREDDWSTLATVFIRVDNPNLLAGVTHQLQQFKENYNQIRTDFQITELVLDSFTTMAHADREADVRAHTYPAPPISAVSGSTIMAILMLLLACFNLTNTAIAISSGRLKEIGIRKVMGSRRMQLVIQFIGETTIICLLALLLGLALADPMVEGWNGMTMGMFKLTHTPLIGTSFLLFIGGVLLFAGLVAGSYPAFYITRFRPVSILKGKLKFGGTNHLTRVLLGLQFAITFISIVSAIAFYQNARYQREYDLGFDMRGAVIVVVNDNKEFETYRNSLQGNADIVNMAGAETGLFSYRPHEPIKHESKRLEVDIITVGDNYLKTLDIKLVEGRDFVRDSKTDQTESILVTQKMATLLGWDHSIGKQIIWHDSIKLFVVGVIKDVYTQGLWREMDPMMIRYAPEENYSQIVVSADSENVPAVNEFMKAQWNKTFPNRLYNGRMLAADLHEINSWNVNMMYLYVFVGIVTLLLSISGLYSMVSLNIIRRMKEIGVRKVLGASGSNIARMINIDVVIILLLASLLGCWSGYTWCNVILGSIWKYYHPVSITAFIIAIGLLFTACFATIGYKVLTVSKMNPVNILRDE